VLRARLEGGIRYKAPRGELRKALPVGLVWGDEEGEIVIEPDEAVRGAIQTIFDRFAELGSVRQVWLWMRREGVQFPMRRLLTARPGRTPSRTRPGTLSGHCPAFECYAILRLLQGHQPSFSRSPAYRPNGRYPADLLGER
jgi:hypothetical protein